VSPDPPIRDYLWILRMESVWMQIVPLEGEIRTDSIRSNQDPICSEPYLWEDFCHVKLNVRSSYGVYYSYSSKSSKFETLGVNKSTNTCLILANSK
jgi:hypothetical protein